MIKIKINGWDNSNDDDDTSNNYPKIKLPLPVIIKPSEIGSSYLNKGLDIAIERQNKLEDAAIERHNFRARQEGNPCAIMYNKYRDKPL